MVKLMEQVAPALNKGAAQQKKNRLKDFEDLLFGRRFQQLQRLLGVEPPDSIDDDDDDDDIEENAPSNKTDASRDDQSAGSVDNRQSRGKTKRPNAFEPPPPSSEWDDNLPGEDPLLR